MIVIDTHIWYWWIHKPERLSEAQTNAIDEEHDGIVGVSAISCWEVAKRVEYGKMQLSRPIGQWLSLALRFPNNAHSMRSVANGRADLPEVALPRAGLTRFG